MKPLKVLMALVVAFCSTFVLTSCDEDDVKDAVTIGNYKIVASYNAQDGLTEEYEAVLNSKLASINTEVKNVSLKVAKEAFNIAVKQGDSSMQAAANEMAAILPGFSITLSLVNSKTNEVVTSHTWTGTATTAN